MCDAGQDKGVDVLLADLEHFSESLWRNEEVGEKRFTFFITFVTAVIGGIVTLHFKGTKLAPDMLSRLTVAGCAALLGFGILTYLRMLQRHRVAQEYQKTLRYIRCKLLLLNPSLTPYAVPRPFERGKWNIVRGGFAMTVGTIDVVLYGILLFLLSTPVLFLSLGTASLAFLLWRLRFSSTDVEEKLVPPQYFRAGVGTAIIDASGRVLALERADIRGAWQLPQGGLERDEDPLCGARREVEEETGINAADLELLASSPAPLVYELPPEAQKKKTGRGQVQYWFLFRFTGDDRRIDPSRGGEFVSWKWMAFHEIVENAADFRKPVYRQLAELFSGYLST